MRVASVLLILSSLLLILLRAFEKDLRGDRFFIISLMLIRFFFDADEGDETSGSMAVNSGT